ncbi:hypothetical protein H8E88_26205 [candidate division KSB1 bacterium]|nr:hypothetical protein [candidate division KSB1 bacterium]
MPNKATSKKIKYLILFILLFALLIECSKQADEKTNEVILAKVGNKTISFTEFIRRAEYTVRPPYCSSNTNIHKKIVLNSLIAEKLMSLEAGNDNEFLTSSEIQQQLRGRKEQAMRLVQFFEDAYDKVVLDSTEIKKYFKHAGRKYKISYFNVDDSLTANTMEQQIRSGEKTFAECHSQISPLAAIPGRKVSWVKHENDKILDALFSEEQKKDKIIGPLKISDNQFMFMKVEDWLTQPVITNQDVQDRWRQVSEKLQERDAKVIYDQLIHSIMKEKSIEFSPETFRKLVNLFGPLYFITKEEKKELATQHMFQLGDKEISYENFHSDIEAISNESLFEVDGQVWTVGQFIRELNAHPLVFRNKKMKKNEFGKELQFAIIDMVRDSYLTKEAYKKGYDELPAVKRDVQMWTDNLNYIYQKTKYLKSTGVDTLGNISSGLVIDRYLNNYVDSLQTKYSDIVEVNMEAFEKIKLLRVNMSVIQNNVSFAKPVPGFPQITTDFRLDYGKKMK